MRLRSFLFQSSSPALMRGLLAGGVLAWTLAALPSPVTGPWTATPAFADEEPPPPPPPPEDDADEGAPSPDDAGATDDGPEAPPDENSEIAPLEPGEAVVTRFSHTVEQKDDEGKTVTVIDINGISASIIDIRKPGEPPAGQHWIDEPQRMLISAGEVGQVFGVALGDSSAGSPDIFLSATAAYGLHRDGPDWMAGMWGPDAGPGTIYKISVDTGYGAEKFADVKLNGRDNTAASLGNIAYDRWHGRLFVSDLETGMIHSFDAKTGNDLGHFDHGVSGRTSFIDAWTGEPKALDPVTFDPTSKARYDSCGGDFNSSTECWNLADFRRRVWGLSVAQDGAGVTRLYYSVWGSEAFGNPDWPSAGDDRRNSVWSIAITSDGLFDPTTVRREYFMPAFWPSDPSFGSKAGNSNAVSDIAFPNCGPQSVMLTAERGAQRNLGLDKEEAFARPYESRVVRHEIGNDGIWRPKGRYDVGFHDRSIKDGQPILFASAAGGAAFGFGLDDGVAVASEPSMSVWMTGDGLCSPDGPCTDENTGEHSDASQVHGLQGTPASAFVPVEPAGALDTSALDDSYMIDTDLNLGPDGEVIAAELQRNDATRIGDVAIYEVCGAPPLPDIEEPVEEGGGFLPPVVEPPEDWPVHTLKASHEKWASTGHRVKRSWHRREGSWHDVDRSWHWKRQSYHSRNKTWHWREGSWHTKARSWHRKSLSLHDKRYSWHFRDRSWHLKARTYHVKDRTWGGHEKSRSWHVKGRTWGDHVKGKSYHVKSRTWSGEHVKVRSYHVKDRTWTGNHVKGRTYHKKSRTWDDGNPLHVKGRTFHKKNRTWDDGNPVHVKGRTFHKKNRTWDDGNPVHVKGKTFHRKGKTFGGGDDGGPVHVKGKTFHKKGKTFGGGDGGPAHVKGKTFHKKGKTFGGGDGGPVHVKGKTFHVKGKTFRGGGDDGGTGDKPRHVKGKTFHKKGQTFGGGGDGGPVHVKGKTFHVKGKTFRGGGDDGGTGDKPRHVKGKTFHKKGQTFAGGGGNDGGTGDKPRHVKGKTFHKKGQTFAGGGDDGQPQHTKRKSKANQGNAGDNNSTNTNNNNTNKKPKHRKNRSFHQVDTSNFVQG